MNDFLKGTLNVLGSTGYSLFFGQGLGTAIDEGTFGQGRKGRAAGEMQDFQENLAQQQIGRAGELQQELEAQGRPEMQAEVDRLSEVASLAEQYAREGMPEEQRQAAATDIARNQAMMLGGASSMGAGLRGLGATQASTAQSYRNLAAQDAAIAQQNQNQYLRSLSNLSQAEATQEGFNVIAPYQEKQAEMQALLGSGIQNQMGMLGFNYQNAAQNQQMLMDLGATAAQVGVAASDARLKENIKEIGHSESGIPMYEWNYKGHPATERYRGTMAQDLINLGYNKAVVTSPDGYYAVDYSKIDVEFTKL